MKQTPLNSNVQQTTAKKRLSEQLEIIKVDWPPNLPQPVKFPAKLKDFFRLIVSAKTPADCTRRLRQFLRETMRPEVIMPYDAHWYIPHERFTDAERDAWAVSQMQAIKDGDKKAGYFSREVWLGMASGYNNWWKDQKSTKASESAKKRKPRS